MDIFAIGFGEADNGFLKKIATSDDLAIMTTTTEPVKTFAGVGQRISDTITNIRIHK